MASHFHTFFMTLTGHEGRVCCVDDYSLVDTTDIISFSMGDTIQHQDKGVLDGDIFH